MIFVRTALASSRSSHRRRASAICRSLSRTRLVLSGHCGFRFPGTNSSARTTDEAGTADARQNDARILAHRVIDPPLFKPGTVYSRPNGWDFGSSRVFRQSRMKQTATTGVQRIGGKARTQVARFPGSFSARQTGIHKPKRGFAQELRRERKSWSYNTLKSFRASSDSTHR